MTIYSLDQKAAKKGRVQRVTEGSTMKIHGAVASSEQFLAGHFAEITLQGIKTIVEVFHNDCIDDAVPEGSPGRTKKVAYYWIDPEHPERGTPLFQALNPVNLGPYERIISDPAHKAAYTALVGVAQEIPDGLLMVRAIYWIQKRGGIDAYDPKLIAKQALSAVSTAAANARKEHDRQMQSVLQTLPEY